MAKLIIKDKLLYYSVFKKTVFIFSKNRIQSIIRLSNYPSGFYETPKNILLSKNNKDDFNDELNRKPKYKKIFNENILK